MTEVLTFVAAGLAALGLAFASTFLAFAVLPALSFLAPEAEASAGVGWFFSKTDKNQWRYILGAPFPGREAQTRLYADALRRRFTSKGSASVSADAVDFTYRAYDRLVSKAIGLLTFNALLFAAFGVLWDNFKTQPVKSLMLLPSGLLPLLACLPLLFLLWMGWGPAKDYESNDADFTSMVKSVCTRTWAVGLATWLSGIDIFCLGVLAFHLLKG